MLNKFYKIIHNKYYRFFKFIFFLRYLFVIFFISIILFLTIPYFFDYEKRAPLIEDHLMNHYGLSVNEYEAIEFQALPLPKLKFKKVNLKFKSKNIKFDVETLVIYPKVVNIFNYQNFNSRKIVLKENDIILNLSDFKFLINYYRNQKSKISVHNANLKIIDKKKPIVNLKKIKLSNFGYNKNLILGEIFEKKFKAKIKNNFEKIIFKIQNSGFGIDIRFDENRKNNFVSGKFKSKILDTNVKANFKYDNNTLNIFNSYLRNKNISLNNITLIKFAPFLEINSITNIEDLNDEIFKELELNELLMQKKLIKELNIKKEINFKSNKFSNKLIDKINLKIDLAYGRASYVKKFSFSKNIFNCSGNTNLLEEFPILFFECSIIFNNDKFLNKFSKKSEDKIETLKLNIYGNLNIINNKINFKKISSNKNYEASKEDLKYYKELFENKLFDENFFKIFYSKKIKEFIIELS